MEKNWFKRIMNREVIKKQCDIHVVNSTFVCEHPKRKKDYYSSVAYKCWECNRIVVAN